MRNETAVKSQPCPRLVIGSLRGGTGKTLVTMGIIAAWRAQGIRVAPFKKGPDYIDPAWLTLAAGRPCRNLDTYLMSEKQILFSAGEHGSGADILVVEGNHGLYDGLDAHPDPGPGYPAGSTAELARLLQAPVVLLVDCTKATRTVAAMVLGCQRMDPEVHLAGVILNRVATPRQEAAIRTAVEEICGLPVLGSIPRLPDTELPERHLGLLTPAEHREAALPITVARRAVENHADLEAIRALATAVPPLTWTSESNEVKSLGSARGVRIGVVRDSAFTFYYPENLEALERLGATLVEINALTDPDLPPLDALYIGGGYPETHAGTLAANSGFRKALRREIEAGLPVIAECGGLIYLGEAMVMEGVAQPMVGVFPVTFELGSRPQGHGYTRVEVGETNPFFAAGTVLRGHEFRYSRVRGARPGALRMAFRMERGYGFDGKRDGLVYKNVLASFCHFHAGGTREWASALVRQARLHANRRRAAAVHPSSLPSPLWGEGEVEGRERVGVRGETRGS
ncbi:MAG: cobyrinate a,c-diamide synthase [Candidatus Tectomicrobia bacterium]|uniref:Cobyrinate a,c-diamide synthase n=1 Tax=Tectimicrobiota bacterium TaxID=2528274 RepID=A0A932GM83_UNCTE|nr:cobyrinate a,c-diamide synthase [Candidatus Tectomicrobia bacterium]